jgi:hypothetical protein
MFEAVPDLNWVARPSNYARSHESGRSVEVTIAGLDTGTGFGDFTPRSLAYANDGLNAGVPPLVSTAGALPEYQPPASASQGSTTYLGCRAPSMCWPIPRRSRLQSRIALDHHRNHYDAPLAAKHLLQIFDDVVGLA